MVEETFIAEFVPSFFRFAGLWAELCPGSVPDWFTLVRALWSMKTVCFLLVVVALFAVQGHSAVLYAGPEASGVNCTMDFPCSLQTACAAAVAMDTVQLLDGNYQMGSSPCIISSPNVSVIGSENAATVCDNSCFVLEAIPFSLSSLYISTSGTSEPTAAIYGENVVCDLSESLTFGVQISNVDAQVTHNDFFFLGVATEFTNDTVSVDVAIENTIVRGNGATNAEVGCISANVFPYVLSWTFTSLTVDGYDSYIDSPFLDVTAFQGVSSLVVNGLTVQDSDLYCVINADLGTSCVMENVTITNVQNYASDEEATAPLIRVDSWAFASVTNLSFSNMPFDTSGLVTLRAQTSELSGLTITNCTGNGAEQAVLMNCLTGPCVHTITDMEVTNVAYRNFAYLISDPDSASTLTIETASFTDLVSWGMPALDIVAYAVVLDNLTFTGGEYDWGPISLTNPRAVASTAILADGVDTGYPFISVTSDTAAYAELTFDQVDVEDSSIFRTVFLFGPGDSVWNITISNSDFATTGTNTTAVVTCFGDDTDTGGADVLVESSSCDLGDTCAVEDEGYVSAGVCNFDVDDAAICDSCSSSSAGSSGDGDGDDNSPEYWQIALWVLLGLAVVVCIVIVLVAIVVIAVVIARKRKRGYDAI